MRIIGGMDRGRKLKAPAGTHTRPTLDKVRGAVFNCLFDVEGQRVLDMFGGSGAMGLEALSRGAESCVIVDNDTGAFQAIEANKNTLSCGSKAELRFSDFRSAFQRGDCFDIIFLDPPYRLGLLEEALQLIDACGLLRNDGIVVAETDAKLELDLSATALKKIKEKQYGITKIIFMKY